MLEISKNLHFNVAVTGLIFSKIAALSPNHTALSQQLLLFTPTTKLLEVSFSSYWPPNLQSQNSILRRNVTFWLSFFEFCHARSPLCPTTLNSCALTRPHALANGHITLKTPLLVRSAKLSNFESGQYLDGWPPGNTRCCWHFVIKIIRFYLIKFT